MQWAVFKDTLKYSWLTTLLWGMGLAAMMLIFIPLTPVLEGMELVELFKTLPPVVLAAAGISEDIEVMATPEGLIAMGFFGKFALIFAAYPVVMGLRIITNEEAEGTLDMVLSLPVARSRVLFEKFLAYALNIVVLVLMVIGGMYLGLALTPSLTLNTDPLIVITLNLIPVMIFVLAATVFVGALISRKQTVVIIMTVFVIGSFMIQTIGAMISASWMDIIEAVSFFTYYNVEKILKFGANAVHITGLTALAVALLAVAIYSFNRRDVGV